MFDLKNYKELLPKNFTESQERIVVDATPDEEYPIRILEAYLKYCDIKICTDSAGNCDNPIVDIMNKASDERRAILTEAIDKLRRK